MRRGEPYGPRARLENLARLGSSGAHRASHGGRGLPRVERGDPRGRGARAAARRGHRRHPRRLGRADRRSLPAARSRRGAGHPAARRHDPRDVAARPLRPRRRRGLGEGRDRGRAARRADRRWGGRHPPQRARALGGGCSAGGRPEDDRQRHPGNRRHVRLRHGRADRNRGDRPHHDDRGVARPRDGRRGDGPYLRLDRGVRRHRGGGRRDPRARGALRPSGAGPFAEDPRSRWPPLLRGRRRRRHRAAAGSADRGPARRVRVRAARRRVRGRRGRARAVDGVRGESDRPRLRPAGWHAERGRPRARVATRRRGRRPRRRGCLRPDGRAARDGDRRRAARRRPRRAAQCLVGDPRRHTNAFGALDLLRLSR